MLGLKRDNQTSAGSLLSTCCVQVSAADFGHGCQNQGLRSNSSPAINSVTPILQTRKPVQRGPTCAGPGGRNQHNQPGLGLTSPTSCHLFGPQFPPLCQGAEPVWTSDWRTGREGPGRSDTCWARDKHCRMHVGCSSCLLVVSFLAGQLSAPT